MSSKSTFYIAEDFAAAAAIVSPYVDVVDLNCGCPQAKAKAECFGAFLLDHVDLVASMVRGATKAASVPIFVKCRLKETLEESIHFVKEVEKAGAYAIARHARRREQRHHEGIPDWNSLRQLVFFFIIITLYLYHNNITTPAHLVSL